jgi:vitamin B12/bleomycin/antimicrobial peptide transport system ATP-binding/permease protein
MKTILRDAWQLAAPYWRSKEKWAARLLLAVIVGLNLGQVYISVRINKWNNDFYNALQNMNEPAFYSLLGTFSLLAGIYIVIAVYKTYLNQMLQIKWRRWMTANYIDNWLHRQSYYRLQVEGAGADNPDQRIAEDVGQFIDLTLGLGLGLLSSIVSLASFLTILWGLSGALDFTFMGVDFHIPGYMVWAALAYAAVGTWVTKWIGRPLARLNFDQQRYEADFRFSLVRLRENAESVAFYGGETAEKVGFAERFARVFDNYWRIMKRQKALGWFTSGYYQIAIIFPYVVAASRYFSQKTNLGDLMQTASAFGEVQGALSYIIDAYMNIATWRAVIDRLKGFDGNIRRLAEAADAPEAFRVKPAAAPAVAAENLSIYLPDGQPLQTGISFSVGEGEALLIQGPSGAGKSTLLRAIAGIWPYAEGKLQVPANNNALFIPQKPYLPLGTLREALAYPSTEKVPNEALVALLDTCQLPHLAHRLDEVAPWSHMLSLGEQQRIGFLRALLMKQGLLFLDEATSALDEASEAYFYGLLRERLPKSVIVSVGHRSTLQKWHGRTLNLKGSAHETSRGDRQPVGEPGGDLQSRRCPAG